MRRALTAAPAIAAILGAAAAPAAKPVVWRAHAIAEAADSREADRPDGQDAGWREDAVGPFFYPEGYDPQYGSDGRVADAADFAAGYGCRSIWNAKTGRRMPACN